MARPIKSGSLVRRYASALFDLALEDGRVGEMKGELQRLEATLEKVPGLYKALDDIEVPHQSKRKIISEIAKLLSLSQICQNSLMIIIENGRLQIFDSIVDSYLTKAEEYERMAHVKAQIANPSFAATIKNRIEKVLSDTLKKKVVCETNVDPSLIGGAVVRIGDVVIDASIAGRLAKMKEELI